MSKAETSLAKIRGLVETELSKHFEKGKFAFREKKYNKESIYYLGAPQMPGFGPHYALVNNFLLVTLDGGTIKEMLDLLKGEGKDSVCNDPDFLEVCRCRRCNSLTYINVEDTFEGIAGLVEYALRLRGEPDLERLLFLPALLRCFTIIKTIGSKAVHEPDGIRENFTILLN